VVGRHEGLGGKQLLIAIVISTTSILLAAIAIEQSAEGERAHLASPSDSIAYCRIYWNGRVEKQRGYRSADLIWDEDLKPVLSDEEAESKLSGNFPELDDSILGSLAAAPAGLALCELFYAEDAEIVCESSCYELVRDNVVAGSATVDCESCLDRNKDGRNKGCLVEEQKCPPFSFNAIIESIDKNNPRVARVTILEENNARTKAIVDRVRIRDWKNVGERVHFHCWGKSDASQIIRYEYCEP
jgi:hypothetical protein